MVTKARAFGKRSLRRPDRFDDLVTLLEASGAGRRVCSFFQRLGQTPTLATPDGAFLEAGAACLRAKR